MADGETFELVDEPQEVESGGTFELADPEEPITKKAGDFLQELGAEVSDQGPAVGLYNKVFGANTDEAFQKKLEEAPAFSPMKDTALNVGKTAMSTAMDAFGLFQAGFWNPTSRLASAAKEVSDGTGFIHGFLNPHYIQAMREKNGLPAEFSQAWDQAKKEGKQFSFLTQEILPYSAEPADVGLFNDLIENKVADIEDPDLKNIARAAFRFSYNVGMDPAMYLTMGSLPVLKEGEKVIKGAANEARSLDEAMAHMRSLLKDKVPQTAEQIAKDRSLVRVKIPFLRKEIPLIKGEAVARTLDNINASMSARTPIRKFVTGVGDETGSLINRAYDIGMGIQKNKLDQFESFVKASPVFKDHDVMKYAATLSQHGDEFGPAVYKAQGGRALNPEELKAAQEARGFVDSAFEEARRFTKEQTGIDIDRVRRPNPGREKELMQEYGIDKDAFTVVVDGKKYNYAIPTNYGFGRRARPDVINATRDIKDFSHDTSMMNLKTGAGPLKARIELSDEAASSYMDAKHGLDYYDKNLGNSVHDKLAEIYQFSNDYNYMRSMKEAYGVEINQVPEMIESAKVRVNASVNGGKAPLMEDLILSKMRPKDFKKVSGNVFDTMKYVAGDESGKNIAKLIPQGLYYPKHVADSIEAMFWRPSQNGLAKFFNGFSNVLAKNILTNPLRFSRQGIENMTVLAHTDAPVTAMFREMGIGLKEAKTGNLSPISKEIQSIPTLSETITDLGHFNGRAPINKKIIGNDDIANLPQAYAESVHELAKKGPKSLGEWVKGAVTKAPMKAVDIQVNNPISRFFRNAGRVNDVMAKRAYYRFLREKGYEIPDAVQQVNKFFMDFTHTSGTLRRARWINPFMSFQMKNLERMVALSLNAPIMPRVFNPNGGYLKRAIQDAAGWDPHTAAQVQKEIPALRDGALSFVLKGNEDLAGNASEARKFANQYYLSGLSEEEKDRFNAQGGILNLKYYDPYQAGSEFTDFGRLNENVFSPQVSAIFMGIAGYDTFKQKFSESTGTSDAQRQNLMEALQKVDPSDYKRFNAITGQVMKLSGKFLSDLYKQPLDQDTETMLSKFNDENYKRLLDQNQVMAKIMSEAKFLGFGRMSPREETFFFHQMSLMNLFKHDELDLKRGMKEGDKDRAQAAALRMVSLGKKMSSNADLKEEMDRVYEAAGVNESHQGFEQAPPEDSTGNVQIPDDSDNDYETEDDREPQSVLDVDQKKAADTEAALQDPSGTQTLELMRQAIVPLQKKAREGKLSPHEEEHYHTLMLLFKEEFDSWKKKMSEGYNPEPGALPEGKPTGPLERDLKQRMNPEIPPQVPGLETNQMPEREPASEGP